jgi:hypothetical protein
VVHLSTTLGSGVTSARARLGSIIVSALPVAKVVGGVCTLQVLRSAPPSPDAGSWVDGVWQTASGANLTHLKTATASAPPRSEVLQRCEEVANRNVSVWHGATENGP